MASDFDLGFNSYFDIRYGDGENNKISGFLNSLIADGGGGDDLIIGAHESDQLWGGSGDDLISGNNGNDLIDGGTGDDALFGGWDNDSLYGGGGNDGLHGGWGDDWLNGYGGTFNERDELLGDEGADVFVLGDYLPNSRSGQTYYTDVPLSFGRFGRLVSNSYAIITDFSAAEADKIQVYGAVSDYRLEVDSFGVGTAGLDTAIYKGSDLIAIVQDTTDVALWRDFVSARPSIIS